MSARAWRSLSFAGALGAWLSGCAAEGLFPVPGTTVRVEAPGSENHGVKQLSVQIFRDEDDCASFIPNPLERVDCPPYVDRGPGGVAGGQVRVSFRVVDDTGPFAVPLEGDQVEVFHQGFQVQAGGRNRLALVPHGPIRSPQLFILLIDGSGSMNVTDPGDTTSRIDKVRRALLRRDVVDAFFPKDVPGVQHGRTAVVPLVFAGGGVPMVIGDRWLLERPEDYQAVIRDKLQPGQGYTFLYQAIAYAATTLLEDPAHPEIRQAVAAGMQPTIIALTDGFNNETKTDTCGANAPRLSQLLQKLGRLRRDNPAGAKPAVFTVGLGHPAWRRPPKSDRDTPLFDVTPVMLCRNLADQLIDGGVERNGVDNEALARIAEVGGGKPYVSQDTDGLAEAFKAAAAMRYRWFEMRYQLDPSFLRRAFLTRIKLVSLYGMEASIRIHPNAWIDAPPGVVGEDGWARPAPFRVTLRFMLPLIAGLITLGYLPAALYNARRPFRGRAR